MCEIILELDQWFRRRCALNKLLTTHDGRQTTDAGPRVITIAHIEHLVLRLAKNNDQSSINSDTY